MGAVNVRVNVHLLPRPQPDISKITVIDLCPENEIRQDGTAGIGPPSFARTYGRLGPQTVPFLSATRSHLQPGQKMGTSLLAQAVPGMLARTNDSIGVKTSAQACIHKRRKKETWPNNNDTPCFIWVRVSEPNREIFGHSCRSMAAGGGGAACNCRTCIIFISEHYWIGLKVGPLIKKFRMALALNT